MGKNQTKAVRQVRQAGGFRAYVGGCAGQGTVEAAFVAPIAFLAVLMLVQPGILLYDRCVMQAAAAEGCRLLATATDAYGEAEESCEAFVRHRLSSVPPQSCFHVHEGGCSWEITMTGDESSAETSVSITNKVRPLPLLDAGATLLGLTDDEGALEMKVEAHASAQPAWLAGRASGSAPADWVGAWSS